MPTMSPDIFGTVAKRDHLSLFEDDNPNCEEVVDFLKFNAVCEFQATSALSFNGSLPSRMLSRTQNA